MPLVKRSSDYVNSLISLSTACPAALSTADQKYMGNLRSLSFSGTSCSLVQDMSAADQMYSTPRIKEPPTVLRPLTGAGGVYLPCRPKS